MSIKLNSVGWAVSIEISILRLINGLLLHSKLNPLNLSSRLSCQKKRRNEEPHRLSWTQPTALLLVLSLIGPLLELASCAPLPPQSQSDISKTPTPIHRLIKVL